MKRLIFLTVATAIFSTASYAASIDDILSQIKQNNTGLKSLNSQIEAQTASLKTNNNLSDPSIDGQYLFGKGHLGDKWEVGVSQSFDWPGVYSARSKANDARINALYDSYNQLQLQTLLDARQLCIDIICYNKQIQFEQGVLSDLNTLYDKSLKGLEYGEISILDTNKLKIERIGIQQKIDEYTALIDVKAKELQAINGNQSVDVASLTEYPTQNLKSIDTYIDEMRSSSPQLKYYANAIAADNKDASVSKMQGLPKFNVGYKFANELGEKFNGVSFGMSLPIFENKGKVKAAKAQAIASEYEFDNILTTATAQISGDYNKALALGKQISGYREALNSCNNIDILGKALNGGQITLLNYIQELRYFIDAQNVLIELEHDYNSTLSELNKFDLLK